MINKHGTTWSQRISLQEATGTGLTNSTRPPPTCRKRKTCHLPWPEHSTKEHPNNSPWIPKHTAIHNEIFTYSTLAAVAHNKRPSGEITLNVHLLSILLATALTDQIEGQIFHSYKVSIQNTFEEQLAGGISIEFFVVCESNLSSNPLGQPTVFSPCFDGQRVWCKPICVWVEVDGLSYKVTFVARCGLVARTTVDPRITQISSCGTSWEIPDRLYLRLIDTWWLNWVVCQTDFHNYSQVSGYKKHTVCCWMFKVFSWRS